MRIGIPREVKPNEGRVALIPAACAELVGQGHHVFVQAGAGELAGYADDEYRAAGVRTVDDADDLYAAAGTIVKVKEPQPEEYARLRADHLLFCFLHLAAAPKLARSLLKTGLTAVAFESVEEGGRFPILAPMSLIAGRLAAHYGAHLLLGPEGGKGILLGGAPAASRGRVVVLGAGVAGSNAAAVATTLGAEVRVFDRDMSKLESVRQLGPNVTAMYPYPADLQEAVATADLLVGAVLVPSARAPHLVTADLVKTMERGSVIIDISVDQGGCIETTRPTTYSSPTFTWEGVVHFGVANMPGAVPRSASQTLSAALSPYVAVLGDPDWRHHHEPLARGINVNKGRLVHPALATLEI
ncbi:MAG: alanine dehydrogenase [Gammaproteobacteria bacterium]|nr:alanine dehydrogenase [Gammaproteobacteria bacterium]